MISERLIYFKTSLAESVGVFPAFCIHCFPYYESDFIVAVPMSADLFCCSVFALLFIRCQSKMVWVGAPAHLAFMVQFHAFLEFAFKQQPCCLVRSNHFPIKPKLSIPVLFSDASGPAPASGFRKLNFIYESFVWCVEFWHKKSAGPNALNWPNELAARLNRLLKPLISFNLCAPNLVGTWPFKSLQSFLHSALNHASSFRTVQQPCRAAHAAGHS